MSTNAAAIKFAQVGNKIPNFDYTPAWTFQHLHLLLITSPFVFSGISFSRKKPCLKKRYTKYNRLEIDHINYRIPIGLEKHGASIIYRWEHE